ncbi:MAG: PilZ domain-containing protein [Myxococcales bacterium]|nr:PilZ domain-containing protein [Myxococcales bacterium]
MSEIQKVAKELLSLLSKARGKKLEEADARQRAQLMARLRELVRELVGKDGDERRRFLRVSAPLEVVFRVGEATITAAASEMSLGGLSLRGHLWLITEQQMRIESLRVGDESYPLRVRCRVAWRVSAKDGMPRAGLQFVDIDDEAQAQIRAIFEALFRRFLERLAAGEPLALERETTDAKHARGKTTKPGPAAAAAATKPADDKKAPAKAADKKPAAKADDKKPAAKAAKADDKKADDKKADDKKPADKPTKAAAAKTKVKKETAEYGTDSRAKGENKAAAASKELGPRQRVSDRKW